MQKILVVEDERAIREVLRAYLQKANFEVVMVEDGEAAFSAYLFHEPDLVLLDVMLPGKDGWDILQQIRSHSPCPVIMLTALSDVEHRLTGLNEGADDYIAKPFAGEEVVARVRAVLRRYEPQQVPVRRFGSLEIFYEAHRVTLDGVEITMRPRDMALLLFLSANPNRTYTREELIEHVWGWDYEGSDRAVDLSIKRLRQALQEWPTSEGELRTVRGMGYQLYAAT